ncbi:hypothetical protein V6N13_106964 [Hibiscus sabdariffa]
MERGEEGGIGMVENNLVKGDGPKLVNHVIAKGGDYKVLEVDVPEFSSREELAVGVTPLNGEALRRQRWFQFLGFRAWTVVLISLVMIRRLMELKLLSCWLQNRLQRLILTPERKADVARGSLLGKDDFGTELNDLKEDAGIDMLERASPDKIDGGLEMELDQWIIVKERNNIERNKKILSLFIIFYYMSC